MKYKKLPQINKMGSQIIFGTAGAGFLEGTDQNQLLDEIYALGINTIDTARNYGLSEKSIGKWLKDRGNRDNVILITKCGHPDVDTGADRISEVEIREDFAVSSEYLGTDYFDYYLMHRDDESVPVGKIVEIFHGLHEEGKIGGYGGSNWRYERIQEANEYAEKHGLLPFAVSSPNYGVATQVRNPWIGSCVSVAGAQEREAQGWYEKNQMPVLAYSSLGRGMFSGRVKSDDPVTIDQFMDEFAKLGYLDEVNLKKLAICEQLAEKKGCSVSQIAMAWMFQSAMNVFAIISTSSAEHMKNNIASLDLVLTEEEYQSLDI